MRCVTCALRYALNYALRMRAEGVATMLPPGMHKHTLMCLLCSRDRQQGGTAARRQRKLSLRACAQFGLYDRIFVCGSDIYPHETWSTCEGAREDGLSLNRGPKALALTA